MSPLTVLASYPKSGNTWLRAFVESLRAGGREVDINANMAGVCAAADRAIFDLHSDAKAAELSLGEIIAARPEVWRRVARSTSSPPWIKIHDALKGPVAEVAPMFPADTIGAVIYVVRDPRDVAVSLAFHFAVDLDAAIDCLNDEALFLDLDQSAPSSQLPQYVSSWSSHVASWLDAPDLNRLVVRYEDMHACPAQTFDAVARFLGLANMREAVDGAIAASSFGALQAQEDRNGFQERDATTLRFFRRGEAAAWGDMLSAAQAARIVEAHGPMMRKLGYV